MTPKSEKLAIALKMLEQVKGSLNVRAERCAHCGLSHYSSKRDWEINLALEGAIGRITKAAKLLEPLSAVKGEDNDGTKTDAAGR
jgi:hypothetical protein